MECFGGVSGVQCSGDGIVQFVIVKFSKVIVEWSRDEKVFYRLVD